jgi:hypothetical protein
VNDDLSVCGITIVFRYTNNTDRVDKYDAEVKNVNLYVFDENGLFMDEYRVLSNTVKLNLMPGTYSFVAWGNLTDEYIKPELRIGVTTLDSLKLTLKRESNEITHFPTSLYYGNIMRKDVRGDMIVGQVDTINLIKDAKHIRITSKGLPVSETKAVLSDFSCGITSLSADLKFDNTVTGSEILEYVPKLSIDNTDSIKQLVSAFTLVREYGDNDIRPTNSTLTVQYAHPNGQSIDTLRKEPLLPLLLARIMDGASFETQDTFNITLIFDVTFGNISVEIEDWEYGGGNTGTIH